MMNRTLFDGRTFPALAPLAFAALLATPGALSRTLASELRGDRVELEDGSVSTGTLLDETDRFVVVRTASAEVVHPRALVKSIHRELSARDEKVIAFVRRKEADVKTADHWLKLARFCEGKGLWPEARGYLRRYLERQPDDRGVRQEVGDAELDGKWIDALAVREKIAAGWELKDGRLVAGGGGKTVVAPEKEEHPSNIVLLERGELGERERTRIERERKKAMENAEKFRQKLEREYAGRDWNERFKYQTRHFEVHCNSTYEVTKNYAILMELIRDKLSEMFRSPVLRRTRAPVFIYCNQEEFMNNDSFARWGGRGLGGYYTPTNQSITTYHGTFGFTGTTFGVLSHEGTHYYEGLVLKGGFDNVPIWLIEGLAVYFGDGSKLEIGSGKPKIHVGLIPRDRLAHIQEKMLAGRHTPIKDLVKMTRYSGFSGSHYADAWALIYFLVNSGKKGKRLLQAYWDIGMKEKLTQKHFLKLAEHFFGDVKELEKAYVDYILKLRPPPAGKVRGEYFISDSFQFQFKAPGPEWQFFEDHDDKKLLIGLLLPGTSAEIRIYYENNIENAEAEDYFENYLRVARHFEGLTHEKVTISGLSGYKLTYVDDGEKRVDLGALLVIDDKGNAHVKNPEALVKAAEEKKSVPRDVVKYMLIQRDGVASIECSAHKGESEPFRKVFDKASSHFRLILTRRW